MSQQAFRQYIERINKVYSQGIATEHSHRGALEQLVTSFAEQIEVINEPKRIACGAPDLLVNRRQCHNISRLGHIETKDIGRNLTKEARTEQIKKRYLPSLDNFILTDYIEFRWYVHAEPRMTVRLAEEGPGGKFKLSEDGPSRLTELFEQFFAQQPEPIAGARHLAVKMGHMARYLCDVIQAAFEREDPAGSLHSQFEGFRQVLLHDLQPGQFADMYAQTICYGLFTAACNLDGPDELTRQNAEWKLPKTNPFLQKMFGHIAGPDLDERIAWLVDDIVGLLNNTQMDSVLRDFARQSGRQDPVVHFYETFLKEYDPRLRQTRGVYYTPEAVVSYIVRSVDKLLVDKFDLPRGLADNSEATYKTRVNGKTVQKPSHRCLILDPACGTGTFLFEVIRQIEQKVKQSQAGTWSGYVGRHLLPRIFGFELLMAPYTVAHMKLGLELQRSGYDFSSNERVGIYLTNTLEEAEEISQNVFVQWISDEARAANKVKQELPIMVVLGNPPYANFGQLNREEWILDLLKDYKKGLKEKKLNLDDDFIKFIRFGQWRIENSGSGILAFITNNTFIDGITHRRMRESLLESFSDIYILNLHGNSLKRETTPDGGKDENVFDIRQGVAISIFVKKDKPNDNSKGIVRYQDIWGTREDKYKTLEQLDITTTDWITLDPQEKWFFFVPKTLELQKEYEKYTGLNSIFRIFQSGIQTDRDALFFDYDKDKLKTRMKTFYSEKALLEPFKGSYRIHNSSGYDLLHKRSRSSFQESNIERCLYRPFDSYWLYYSKEITSRSAWEVMQHLHKKDNLALLAMRQYEYNVPDYSYILVSNTIVERRAFISNRGAPTVFPLYLYQAEKKQGLFDDSSEWPGGKDGRVPNLDKGFVEAFAGRVGLEFVSDGRGDLGRTFGPEDLFDYIYAVFHSPWYRQRYAEFLKIDFPRVPWIDDKKRFCQLVEVGDKLRKLHLLEDESLGDVSAWPKFEVSGSGVVEKGYPRWLAKQGQSPRVYINAEQYFGPVGQDVWEFHIGGYQVCAKWLKDRRGRELSFDEIEHYQKMTTAIEQTIGLMNRLQAMTLGAVDSE